MGIIKYTAVIYTFIYLLMCYDRVTPPDDSTDEGSLSRPLRSVQSSSLQPAPQKVVVKSDSSLLSRQEVTKTLTSF